jgi:Fe-S cluster biosynthesis and repair protein YggX
MLKEGNMHKFLFEQKTWKAKGTYTDEKGKKIAVTGTTVVAHQWNKWVIEGEMIIPMKGDKSLELRNTYNVKPMKEGQVETTWTSENKIVGKFTGKFFVAGDVIVSTYSTKDGKYAGFETFRTLGAGKYEDIGEEYFEGKKLSSWNVTLA